MDVWYVVLNNGRSPFMLHSDEQDLFQPWSHQHYIMSISHQRISVPGTFSTVCEEMMWDSGIVTNYVLQPEFRKCWDDFNKMKTKRLSNHMSQYFIHNRT